VCRHEAFNADSDIEIAGNLLANKMELVCFFPDISSTSNEVPAAFNLLSRAAQLRRTHVQIAKAGYGNSRRGSVVFGVFRFRRVFHNHWRR
jgi:hypothetical protein